MHEESTAQSDQQPHRYCSMCGPKFCSMKITQDVRDYAAAQKIGDIDVAIEEGMKEKAEEFRKQGAEIYKEV